MKSKLIFLLHILSISALAQVWSPDGQQIAFFYIHEIEDIYLVNVDGSDFQVIDRHDDRDFSPRWSPDGSQLMFTSIRDGHHEIYELTLEDRSVAKITSTEYNSMDADYSPDGKSMVFVSDRSGNNEIFLGNRQDGTLRQLTSTSSIENSARWSPNGERILFISRENPEDSNDLYTLSVDGTDRQQLTKNSLPEFHASYSPDGRHVCFIRIVEGTFEVHVISADGGKSRKLTGKKGYQAFYPNWSPDGKWIAFTRDVMSGTEEGLPALYVVDMDGKERLVTSENSF